MEWGDSTGDRPARGVMKRTREGRVRPPAVAGTFYPGSTGRLQEAVDSYLAEVRPAATGSPPKALIAPHAGYVYSGPVAASGYRLLEPVAETIERVVLIGPSHRVPLKGLAVSSADAFETPLGRVPVDRAAVDHLLELPQVCEFDAAHAAEHSLEVHLPFLQRVLREFRLVPICAGDASTREVAGALDLVWGGPETLIVVSSDLSHYYDYETARIKDAATTRAIERLDPTALDAESACGRIAIRGLLDVARRRGLQAHSIDVRNSGDTAGPRDSVVGYGAYAFV